MLTTVEGVYKDGQIELKETPPETKESRVIVTFLPDSTGQELAKPKGQMMRKGMFPQLLSITDEDIKAAEFHGDPDDGLDWT